MTDREKIMDLADQELKDANEKYPLFSSPHEAYAVLLEEVEEAEYNIEKIRERMEYMWASVRCDVNIEGHADTVYAHAINGIMELIQVAAMAEKVKKSELYEE